MLNTPRTVTLSFPLDGPIVSFGTGSGALSNGTTYVALDHDLNVFGQATLPAALPVSPSGTSKDALTWNGHDVAAYLADDQLALFAADGSGLRRGPAIARSTQQPINGLARATTDGFVVDLPGTETLWTLDRNGAPLSSVSTPPNNVEAAFALLEVSSSM